MIPKRYYDGPITPIERPEHCPGAYDMHFYCKYDNPDHRFDEFPHQSEFCETRGQAIAQAREAGWIYHRDGTGTCPKCVRALGLRAQPARQQEGGGA